MHYSTFNGAYEDENIPKVERASFDVPTDRNRWMDIVNRAPVIVLYMWSETCRPCLLVRDKFEAMAHRFQNEHVLFFKDNIDLPTSFHKQQIEVVPTFFILCDGKELHHPTYKSVYTGWNENDIKDSIQYHISQSTRLRELQEQQASANENLQEPQLYCYNNVCYIKK